MNSIESNSRRGEQEGEKAPETSTSATDSQEVCPQRWIPCIPRPCGPIRRLILARKPVGMVCLQIAEMMYALA